MYLFIYLCVYLFIYLCVCVLIHLLISAFSVEQENTELLDSPASGRNRQGADKDAVARMMKEILPLSSWEGFSSGVFWDVGKSTNNDLLMMV